MLTSPSIVRRLVAGVFLFAAISKLFDFPGFVSSVARLGWLPTNWSSTAAVLLVEMEFITGLLLLSERTVRPGALLGGLMAGGFTVVTSKLLLQGISTECSCFGIFLTLPPTVMLGIDALLFFACLNLLTHCARGRATATESQDQARGDTITPQTGRAAFAPRLLSVSFLVPTYLVAMAALLQIGYDKERLRVGKHERPTITLRYGDRAPEFVLPTIGGSTISSASLRGKMSLITFVAPWCEPCKAELRDLASRYSAWKSRLNVLIVVIGRPLWGAPEGAARQLAEKMNLPMPVACDADGKVADRYCDRPRRTPFTVLLDREGIVRFIQDAREEGEIRLAHDIEAVLNDTPIKPDDVAMKRMTYGRRVPDGELLIEGKWVNLSTLWRDKPLLLSFLLKDCSPCKRHVTLVERALGNSKAIRVIYVYPNRKEAMESAKTLSLNGIVAADESRKVHSAYQVWNAPTTFLINRGRLIYGLSERSRELELQRLLQQSESPASSEVDAR